MAGRRISLNCLLLILLAPLGARAQDLNEQLLAAARKSDLAAVKTLLEKGADVNAKTRYGATALSYASDRGSLEVAKALIEKGADVNVTDTFYKATPLTWAASNGHAPVVKLLLEKGAQSKETAMAIAVQQGHTAIVQTVLEMGGFKQDALNNYLMMATRAKQPEVAELLKKAGAVVPPPSNYKVEPEALKAYEGKFKSSETEITFAIKDGKLVGTTPTGQTLLLVPSAKHVFEVTEIVGLSFNFTLEGEKVSGMTLKQASGTEIVFKKAGGQ
jgi:ankyrin repeat protein